MFGSSRKNSICSIARRYHISFKSGGGVDLIADRVNWNDNENPVLLTFQLIQPGNCFILQTVAVVPFADVLMVTSEKITNTDLGGIDG